MNCVIPGGNLKIFGKSLQALCRFGDSLHIEPSESKLSIRTVNMTNTAYAGVDFTPTFFQFYEVQDVDEEQRDSLKCKLPMKSMLNAFKNTSNLEKNVLTCKMKYSLDSESLTLKFRFKHEIIKTHIIYLLDGETLEELNLADKYSNMIATPSSIFQHALQNFQTTDNEISFDVFKQKITLRNYMQNDMCIKMLRSQITIHSTDFCKCDIGAETDIRFSLKLFRAAIGFAEAFHLNVSVNFDTSGKPLIVSTKNDQTFEATFVLSTLRLDDETQSTIVDKNTSKQIRIQTSSGSRESIKRKISTSTNNNNETQIDTEENMLEITNMLLNDEEFSEVTENNAKRRKSVENCVKESDHEIVHTVFQRCFEVTQFLPETSQDVLAEDSESEEFS